MAKVSMIRTEDSALFESLKIENGGKIIGQQRRQSYIIE